MCFYIEHIKRHAVLYDCHVTQINYISSSISLVNTAIDKINLPFLLVIFQWRVRGWDEVLKIVWKYESMFLCILVRVSYFARVKATIFDVFLYYFVYELCSAGLRMQACKNLLGPN